MEYPSLGESPLASVDEVRVVVVVVVRGSSKVVTLVLEGEVERGRRRGVGKE